MTYRKTSHPLLVLFLVLACFVMSSKPASANIIDWFENILTNKSTENGISAGLEGVVAQETNTQSFVANLQSTVIINLLGANATDTSAMTDTERDVLQKKLGYGVLGDVSKGIVALYNPPASTKTYVADVMKSARIIPEAQAQGLGFSALDPILETWKTFRNLAYLFFVVIFLVIGFMIMFRVQVHQAAITAQQAIPSVIIAMLAVTFSYAIAGFMIDIMYVVMYMLAGFFSEGSDIVSRNIFQLIGLMFDGGGELSVIYDTIKEFMSGALDLGFVGEALSWLSSLTGTLIIGIAIIFATFKVFFELVKSYVAVIIQIIFSPIILMMGAFPGKNTIGKWIKDLTGNLILWPVVLLCVLVERMLTSPIRNASGTESFSGGFMPPFLIGSGQSAIIPVILGIGILLVIPEIMQQVKKAMGVDEGPFGEMLKGAGQRLSGAWKGGDVGLPIKSPAGVKDALGVGVGFVGSGLHEMKETHGLTGNLFHKKIDIAPTVPNNVTLPLEHGDIAKEMDLIKESSRLTPKKQQTPSTQNIKDRINNQGGSTGSNNLEDIDKLS